MSLENLDPIAKMNKELLQREVVLAWLEQNPGKEEKDWEHESRLEFDLAFDLLKEDAARDIDKEFHENPLKILAELNLELKVVRQIEEMLKQKEAEGIDEKDMAGWRFQHRAEIRDIVHKIKDHDPDFLQKLETEPDIIAQELNEIELEKAA